jgi:Ran GTPase-activating protein (RanGAP) involved in mRNA processing and transport
MSIDFSNTYNKTNEGIKTFSNALAEGSYIYDINLGNTDIDDTDVLDLSIALNSNNSLTRLDLYMNNITQVGAKYLAEALKVNTCLKSLNLFENNIFNNGAIALAEALLTNNTLECLDIGGNRICNNVCLAFSKVISCNDTLTHLNLSDNNISRDGINILLVALVNNSNIISLGVKNDDYNDINSNSCVKYLIDRNMEYAKYKEHISIFRRFSGLPDELNHIIKRCILNSL